MNTAAALVYWVIVAVWLGVLGTICVAYLRNPIVFGTTRLLVAVLALEIARNLVESTYFGFSFGGIDGLFDGSVSRSLGNPYLLILPKLLDIGVGGLALLLLRRRPPATTAVGGETADRSARDPKQQPELDALTGVYARSYFLMRAAVEWERAARYRRPLSLLMIDIDFFQTVNSRFGHQVGDRILVQIARGCCGRKRGSDIVGRVAGGQFALLLPETDLDQAAIVAERLRAEIAGLNFAVEAENASVTVSAGVSTARGALDLPDLMKRADMALYRAKRLGRNRIGIAEEPPDGAKRAAAG
ncbi:MAG TPA: GGDEF domain-containing protein [Stellaceae bacterium]|jgi:diguanylate cyclase (GGDEF)-like protein|nr:GGDEF domain-containing protein [Stellaceae bacterium]